MTLEINITTHTPSHKFGNRFASIADIAAAGTPSSTAAIHTRFQNPASPSIECIRPGRLVSTWKMPLGHCHHRERPGDQIRPDLVMPRSDMLLTNTRRGLHHRNGRTSRSGHGRTSKPCSNEYPGSPRHRSANVRA